MRGGSAWIHGALLCVAGLFGCAGADDSVEVSTGCQVATDCPRGLMCVGGVCGGDADAEPADGAPAVDARTRDDGSPVTDAAQDAERPSADALPLADGSPRDGFVDAAADSAAPECEEETVRDCGRTFGRCRAGRQTCTDGAWGECVGEVAPDPEICNAADDDCDGIVDNGFDVGGPCDGLGVCGAGVTECRSSVSTRCSTERGGSRAEDVPEICDGLDNDCDGRTDEGFGVGDACSAECGPGVLECQRNVAQCSTAPGGTGSVAGAECDGVGACGVGVVECRGELVPVCSTDLEGSGYDGAAERCDGLDNNCDGVTDEGFDLGAACESPGDCGAGVLECGPEGIVQCDSVRRGVPETCDGSDEDCDGAIDEDFGVGAPCQAPGICGVGTGECSADGRGVCDVGPEGSASRAVAEGCDGLDNDCDGVADEGGACGGETCERAPPVGIGEATFGDTSGLADDYSDSTCLSDSIGADQVFRLDIRGVPVGGADYVFAVAPLVPNYDPLFWVGLDCGNMRQCLQGRDFNGAGRPEARIVTLLRDAEHFMVVDARGDLEGGPFVVTVRPFADGERCGTAIPLEVPSKFVGTTDSRNNDLVASACPAGSTTNGKDQAFRFELAAAVRVRIRATPDGDADLTLYVTTDCGDIDGACVGGVNGAGRGGIEVLELELPAGVSYLVIDHTGNRGGPFFLEVDPID